MVMIGSQKDFAALKLIPFFNALIELLLNFFDAQPPSPTLAPHTIL